MQQDEHGAWLLTSPCFFLEFVGISLYWTGVSLQLLEQSRDQDYAQKPSKINL